MLINHPYIHSNMSIKTTEGLFSFYNIFFKTSVKSEDIVRLIGNFQWFNENHERELEIIKNSTLVTDSFSNRKYQNWMKKGLRHVILYNMLTKDYFTVKEAISINQNLPRNIKDWILCDETALINIFSQSSQSYKMMGHTHLIQNFMDEDNKREVVLEMRDFLTSFNNESILYKYDNLISDLFSHENIFNSYEIREI